MTRQEIIEKTQLSANGALSKILSNLVNSGFVREYAFYGHKKRENRYMLSDYYTMFYFRYIKENYGNAHFWKNMLDNPARRAWSGLTFEQVCMDHMEQIKKKLGISGVLSTESTWYVKPDEELAIPEGAQIDLLIDRRDHVINICEIKFSDKKVAIDNKLDRQLRTKIDAFIKSTGCKKTITLTLISPYGVKQNKYSSIVRSEITMEDLFQEKE